MKKYCWILVFILFFSCKREIQIDLPELEIKPVVNCLFTEGEPFWVHISLLSVANKAETYSVDNATVFIIDKQGKYQLDNQDDGYYTCSDFMPVSGNLYTIEAEVPGYELLTASDSIPRFSPQLISYTTRSDVGIDNDDGETYSSVNICFKDNPIKNYYGIDCVYQMNKSAKIENHAFVHSEGQFTNDPSVTNEGLEMFYPRFSIFRDELFNGEEYNFELFYFSSPTRVLFFNYSPTMFQYLRTQIIHDYTKDYDFWEVYESIPMYGNIGNGYGIFAGYSSQIFEIKPDTTVIFNQ